MKKLTAGLTRDFTARRELVSMNDQIYFSDLTDTDLSQLDLSAKRFFGCVLSDCDLRGATLDGCQFENCFVVDDETRLPHLDNASLTKLSIENCNFALSRTNPRMSLRWDPWEPGTAEAIRRGLQGDCEPTFQELRRRMSPPSAQESLMRSPDASALLALCALFLHDPNWEHRLRALSVLSAVLLQVPQATGPMRDVYLAVLLYRIGDPNDMVYHPALELVETFEPDASIIRHAFGRIGSIEPAERREALNGVQRFLSQYNDDSLSLLEGIERLLNDPQQPPDIFREALRVLNHQRIAPTLREKDVRDRLTPALQRLLEHSDEQVRKEALRVVSHFYGWDGRAQVRNLLHDASEDIRSRAFMTLYAITPDDELLALLKDHPPNESCHTDILEHQAYLREKGLSNSLISDAELRPLLTSTDLKARLDGLYYASFLGDTHYLPELMDSLRNDEPAIRIAALRALAYLVDPPADAELHFLESDPDENVRAQLGRTLEAFAKKRG